MNQNPGKLETPLAGTVLNMEAGRRAFLRSLGLGAAGMAVAGATMGGSVGQAQAQAITDADILNFALNLEYLEAEFYLQAAFGRGLNPEDRTGVGDQGTVIGGRNADLSPAIQLYAEEIAMDEENHVQFLRSALGDAAVAEPSINLKGSFTKAANAAGLQMGPRGFDPYGSDNEFLLAAFIFEDVGVTAYKGAAPLIQDPGTLEAAAGILAVEAYHAGAIRTLLIQRGLFFAARKISDLRDAADGGDEDKDQPIGNPDKFNVVPADRNGLAFSRTTREVLNIVYLEAGADRGGFFPLGINS